MNFEGVEKIAAAILYEGYILYPYRPTAIKNRQRWNFGTLYPRVYAQAQRPEEPFRLVAECLVVTNGSPSLDLRLSFLQLRRQQNISAGSTDHLTDPSLAWEEAVERTSEHPGLSFDELPLSLELVIDKLEITVSIGAQVLPSGALKLRLEVQNTTPLAGGTGAKRDEALPLSLVSAHLILGITGGEFVSLLDPQERYREAAAACSNVGVFPVLAGEEPARSMMFCSPIILYDYPKIAPESAGDFFDGTEMDEMLTLRVLTLTDAEKQEMRNGDPRARRILERTEALTSDAMLKTHGALRDFHPDWNPFEESKAAPESVRVFGADLRVGDRVRLRPQKQADIMDLALKGKVAVIEAIEQDFEDRIQFAVVLDDDPGREFGMMRQPGHRFFFSPDEVEPA